MLKKQSDMPSLTIVAERECTEDHQLALRRFECCDTDAPEYEKEVQRYIRGLRIGSSPDEIHRKLLVIPSSSGTAGFTSMLTPDDRVSPPGIADKVIGFCEYGVDSDDSYAISYIAVANKYRHHGLGSFLLRCVLADFADEEWRHPRTVPIGTLIHQDNLASRALFIAVDFLPDGVSEDPEYGVWYKLIEPKQRGPESSTLVWF